MRCLPALFFAGSVGTIALACGGASDQDVISGSSSSTSSSSGTTTSSSSGSNTTSSSGGGSGSSSGGTTSSSGGSSGVTTSDGGPPTPGNCTPESELNNEPGDANEIPVSGSVCGSILTATDLDFLTFELKQGTKTMNFTFTGNVKIRIFVEGHDPVELTPQSSPPIPFVVGKPYLVRVGANSQTAAKVDWRVNVVVTN